MIPEGGFPCGEMGEWAGMGKERLLKELEMSIFNNVDFL